MSMVKILRPEVESSLVGEAEAESKEGLTKRCIAHDHLEFNDLFIIGISTYRI
jgi:hypothetical protein